MGVLQVTFVSEVKHKFTIQVTTLINNFLYDLGKHIGLKTINFNLCNSSEDLVLDSFLNTLIKSSY